MKNLVYKVETIDQLHEIAGLEKPRHPLISVIDYSKVNVEDGPDSGSFACSFYTVNYKKHCSFLYGRQKFDHMEGTLHCTGPEQLLTYERNTEEGNTEGWVAVVRPGNVLFEITGCSEAVARGALARAANKLPVSCKFLMRQTG